MYKKEKVCFPSENKQGACSGVLTGDTSKSNMGLVVLQEWWGMNEIIINEAADISERGNFVALVPDLYRGKIATDHETAGHYMSDLDWPGAVHDIAAAAKYLKQKGRHAFIYTLMYCMYQTFGDEVEDWANVLVRLTYFSILACGNLS